MTVLPDHDYISSYEKGVKALRASPDNRELQHGVVLALARAGALDLAIAEYKRYGLDTVKGHEDIMALDGRLSKDLYLRASGLSPDGEAALEHARDAAHKYGQAYKSTKGYYSGVNAAAMALMADMPAAIIEDKARNILKALPQPEALTPEDHYFIEATRAECHLLLGDVKPSKASLRDAVAFDPLNYAAHATTLKQFNMIIQKYAQSAEWLSSFRPPRPAHFAGHISFTELETQTEREALAAATSDHIQKYDIGFGFGALAAGSDIIIAEALLDEGADLNVVLPCPADIFSQHSVAPFGETWVSRFKACMDAAKTVTIIARTTDWPNAALNHASAQVAMGLTVLRGQALDVDPLQLLIWDGEADSSHTAIHAQDWTKTHRDQITVSIAKRQSKGSVENAPAPLSYVLQREGHDSLHHFTAADIACEAALDMRRNQPEIGIAAHIVMPGEKSHAVLDKILSGGPPQSFLASEAFASLLALHSGHAFNIHFAGLIDPGSSTPMRCYAVEA